MGSQEKWEPTDRDRLEVKAMEVAEALGIKFEDAYGKLDDEAFRLWARDWKLSHGLKLERSID